MGAFESIQRLTSAKLTPQENTRVVKDFAQELGWEPGHSIEPEADLVDVINSHLFVEHGLGNSAVITFLINPAKFSTLNPEQSIRTLEISYNNLVDWHIYVEPDRVTYVFNRSIRPSPLEYSLTNLDIEKLKSSMFDQISGKAPNPNFPALDEALIKNISFWKRSLASELNGKPKISDYSALFNAIIFARAAEDLQKRIAPRNGRLLVDSPGNEAKTIGSILSTGLGEAISAPIPSFLFDAKKAKSLRQITTCGRSTIVT